MNLTYHVSRCDMTGDTWFVWTDPAGRQWNQKVRRAGVKYQHESMRAAGYTQVPNPHPVPVSTYEGT